MLFKEETNLTRDLINEILTLTKLQKIALSNEDIEEFDRLIEKRQVCMDQIDEITNEPSGALNDEDKQILREVEEIDKVNQEEFCRQFENVKFELRKIRELKKRDNMYSNPYSISSEEGIFFDKK